MNSNSQWSLRFFLGLLILFMSNSMIGQAGALVHIHRTGQGYDSIREAINDSWPGDTIVVRPARYEETLIIRHSLTILGESENGEIPVVAPGFGYTALTVINPPRGSEVTIDGMAVEVDLQNSYALLVDVAHFTLRNSRIQGTGTGIGLRTFVPSSVTVENNYFSDFTRALSVSGTEELPVVIRGNTFQTVKESVLLTESPDAIVDSNLMRIDPPPNRYIASSAILIDNSPGAQIMGNAVCSHDSGILVVRSDNTLIQLNNVKSVRDGITVANSSDVTVYSNLIKEVEYALSFNSAINSRAAQNWMEDSLYGLHNYQQDDSLYLVDARDNWWGASDGPSFMGPGSGVPVNRNVWFDPWLTSRPDLDNELKCR